MELTLPISSLLIIAIGSVGVCIAFTMAILLFTQKNKHHFSITLMACLLLLSGATLLNELLVSSGISNRVKQLYFIPIYYPLAIGPVFFLIIKSKFRYRLAKTDYLHLLIPGIQALVYFFIGFRSVAFKSQLWQQPLFRFYLDVESILFPVSFILYGFLSLRLLQKNTATAFFWSDDMRKWLNHFTKGMLVIAYIEMLYSLVDLAGLITGATVFPLKLIHTVTLSAFVLWISINALKQYFPLHIFTSRPKQDSPFIKEEVLAELSDKLLVLMTKEKIYLNPELNLSLLAQYMDVSEKHCSYVLSHAFQSNFNQFINSYRISAFKEMIREGKHQHYTLTSIAYDCGFDSKSTFNRVFKLALGITPSEFVKINQD